MSIYALNLPFANKKRISFSALSSKMNRRLFDKKRCGSNKTFLLTTRQFICAPNVRSIKRDAARTRKKSASSKLYHNWRCEFDPHRHLRRGLRCVIMTPLRSHFLLPLNHSMPTERLCPWGVTQKNKNNPYYGTRSCWVKHPLQQVANKMEALGAKKF